MERSSYRLGYVSRSMMYRTNSVYLLILFTCVVTNLNGFYAGHLGVYLNHFLRSSDPILHMFPDDRESDFFLYEILLHLKHGIEPLVLHEQMQLILFQKYSPSVCR